MRTRVEGTRTLLLAAMLAIAACSSPPSTDAARDAIAPVDRIGNDGTSTDVPASLDAPDGVATDIVSSDAINDVPATETTATDAPAATCPAAALATRLGRTRLLVGGTMDNAPFMQAPFDIRYVYLSGDVPTPGPCASCMTGCSVRGTTCANTGPGCSWWGCWQWDMLPPGQYVTDFVNNTRLAHAIPMFSYYVWFSVAGNVEGAPEIAALNDGARTSRYLADWRFVCQRVGSAGTGPVVLHVEPDLWGFAEQVNQDPTMIPAAVSAAGLTECAGLPNTVAGFAQCMLRLARTNAPNALVAFHASAWGAGADALTTTMAGFDVAMHADRTAMFYRALGADRADLLVVEMSDRDAGFNHDWWDATNATVPNFTRALAWQQRLGQDLGLATLYWQVPYGHLGLPDTCNQYQDNRVDYFFSHPDQFAAAGTLGIAFGAGANCMTTPSSDGGYFVRRAMAYLSAPTRPCLCGAASCP
jgi:hypothetical protein